MYKKVLLRAWIYNRKHGDQEAEQRTCLCGDVCSLLLGVKVIILRLGPTGCEYRMVGGDGHSLHGLCQTKRSDKSTHSATVAYTLTNNIKHCHNYMQNSSNIFKSVVTF